MECRAYCTATSYQIKPLYERLKEIHKPTLYRDVIHMTVSYEAMYGDIFYFPYGVMVAWGLPQQLCQRYLEKVREFEHQPLDDIETDEFTFIVGDSQKIVEDEIILPNDDTLHRLAISHGLAQSVKLGTFENAIRKTFDHTKYIPEDLAKYGSISLSRREIRRKMGELFIERNSINLHVDVLDTPEFFWDYPELEPLYAMTASYLDIETRVEVLNQRLDVVHELFEMLGNELNHQHSSRLEWTIICLIVIEVFLSLLRDVFKVF
ncbi:MAG: RMD1 family protein [Parachlamydiaceae bacterium]|nr:RMD1 family protein [Parachlamydiaceae bacterium]